MSIQSYRDLRVWQEAMSLAEAVYRLTKQFPKDELFGLTSQMRRASVSIPANIAEGYGRESTGAYVQFLRVAQGSLKELETHALLANRVGIMSELDAANLLSLAEAIGKMLRALIRSLEK
ncbi:four helix bundle protein [Bosea sp. BE125]|uniref:four helix bundle protein n=1 Tax=Bosea sp. BE125 TaxID=2817909 RepID=UPI002867A336|nr:four helix bundle protein [Bosea sp. BE125]MDR6870274.1 four helix bundle protein [Bosea sp. BE125]